jgi:CPA2 family monovalent cation:H+ antiporter-2
MEHVELTEVAIVIAVALSCGLAFGWMRQPAIVGYIIAGVFLGPSGFGLVEDREQISFLAELGVLLLLFAIGMELSIQAFRAVLRFAVIGTMAQIAISLAVVAVVALAFGWSWERTILIGFAVSLSSTAVAIKMLEEVGELRRETGRRAVGILIAQDLAIVPMMLIIATLAPSEKFTVTSLLPLIGAVGFLAFFIWFLGRRGRVRLPFRELTRGQADLITLAALGYCFAAAAISGLFGLSTAYGAFLAGLLLGNSTDRKVMLRVTLPIQGVLLMAFFLSIGMLLDLDFIWDHLGQVLLLLLIVTLGKTAMNVGILRGLGEPWPRAWLGGVVLGQIGEFSFVLAALGLSVMAITSDTYRMFVAVIALSLVISPIWLDSARRLQRIASTGTESLEELMLRLYPAQLTALRIAEQAAAGRTRRVAKWARDRRALLEDRRANRRQVATAQSEAPPSELPPSEPKNDG